VLPALKWDCQAADRRAGYITPIEAAELLAVSVKSVYKLASSGEVEALHVGRSVRIKADSLCDYIRRNTVSREGVPEAHEPAPVLTPRLSPEARPRKKKGPAFVFLPPPT
jgi:excisionase family DNA binding protein